MFYFIFYYSADTVKIFINISVAKTNDFESIFFQLFGPYFILFLCLRVIMTTAIQFNDQTSFGTEKICNIISNCFLSLKPNRIVF